jgi:hypothetical protein
MDAMMERMNTILGDGGGRTSKQNKETVPLAANANRGGNKEAKKVKHKKKHCPPPATCLFSTRPTDGMSWKLTRTSNG